MEILCRLLGEKAYYVANSLSRGEENRGLFKERKMKISSFHMGERQEEGKKKTPDGYPGFISEVLMWDGSEVPFSRG
jgi:hypothetical protein